MKIALIGPVPPPNGGMAMQTMQLSQLLESRGHQVTQIALNSPYRPRWVGRIPVIRALVRLLPYLLLLQRQLRGNDVVHIMANSGWAWYLFAVPAIHIAAVFNIPTIVNYRGGLADRFLRSAAKRVRYSLSHCAALIVPSGFLKSVFQRYQLESAIIPNIVNLERFIFRSRSQLGNAPHLVVTRNLELLYGNHHALEVLAALLESYPDARLSIAGEGPQRNALNTLARELNIEHRVTFWGRLDRDQMAQLYDQADILLNPSTADNMPNALLEAMAAGVPIVTTDAGGIPFLVRNGESALIVPMGDTAAMVDAVRRLLNEPDLVAHLSEQGHKHAQHFTPDRVVPQWEQLYEQLREHRSHA